MDLNTDMNGKTVIVTGSTSGIGLGLARGFAAANANVVMNGFGDADAIETDRVELARLGAGEAIYDPADMTKPDEIAAMVAWLSSPECSFSTGAVFDLSGGRATY